MEAFEWTMVASGAFLVGLVCGAIAFAILVCAGRPEPRRQQGDEDSATRAHRILLDTMPEEAQHLTVWPVERVRELQEKTKDTMQDAILHIASLNGELAKRPSPVSEMAAVRVALEGVVNGLQWQEKRNWAATPTTELVALIREELELSQARVRELESSRTGAETQALCPLCKGVGEYREGVYCIRCHGSGLAEDDSGTAKEGSAV